METIPLTVLAYEGPGSRAYLTMMASAGYRPSKIIAMISSHGESGGDGKRIGRLLPGFLRSKYAARVQELRRMYWPRRIRKQHPELYASIATGLSPLFDEPRDKMDTITGQFRFEDYSDHVTQIMLRNYRDPKLPKAIEAASPAPVLFTGGGILPPELIRSGPKYIHVHPGKLPHVRGADGLLWSTLVRGQPGAACFYMNEGIDTGEIIETTDLPSSTFQISDADRPDDQTLYSAIFSFYDPLLRAKLFTELLTRFDGNLPNSGTAQSTEEGTTYHFMHGAVRRRALQKIFVS